jgi:hypothetical protein
MPRPCTIYTVPLVVDDTAYVGSTEACGVCHTDLHAANGEVSKDTEPLYMVAVQLNTLIADGTATRKLIKENTMLVYIDWPATNTT